MKLVPALGCLALAIPVSAQTVPPSEAFRSELAAVPEMAVVPDTLPVAGARLGFISAVSVDRAGNLYVLHRPDNGDPVVVLDPMGRFVRSWGEGLFGTPHGIRVDPEGNVWTVDAGTSVVHKFTSSGVLLQSARFEVPVFPRPFCGATDVAFGANGSVFLTDGYCNGRIVKLDSTGREVGEWGAWGSDRDNSSSRTASPSRPMGASSSPTETTHAFKSSIKTGAGWTRGNTLAWWPPSR